MTDDEVTASLARLDAGQDELRRMVDRVERRNAESRESLMRDVNAKSEMVAQLDTIVRGDNGANGLRGRVSMLEARLEISDEHLGGRMDSLSATSQQHYVMLRRYILGLVATITGAVVVRYLLGL
jgi:hypothetical protein